MTTPRVHAPEIAHKNSRVERGLALFRERASEITETSPGVFRVPGSDGATYTVRLDAAYCSCPDRAENCKHLYCVEVYAAKKNAPCRRQHTAPRRPSRRHTEISPSPTEDRRNDRRGSGPDHPGSIGPGRHELWRVALRWERS